MFSRPVSRPLVITKKAYVFCVLGIFTILYFAFIFSLNLRTTYTPNEPPISSVTINPSEQATVKNENRTRNRSPFELVIVPQSTMRQFSKIYYRESSQEYNTGMEIDVKNGEKNIPVVPTEDDTEDDTMDDMELELERFLVTFSGRKLSTFYFDMLETENTFDAGIMAHVQSVWEIVVRLELQKRVVFMFHKKAFEPSNFSILLFEFLYGSGVRYGIRGDPETYEEGKQFIEAMSREIGYFMYKPEMWSFDWEKIKPTTNSVPLIIPDRHQKTKSITVSLPVKNLCSLSLGFGMRGFPISTTEHLSEVQKSRCYGMFVRDG
jgi:hypothetical protein